LYTCTVDKPTHFYSAQSLLIWTPDMNWIILHSVLVVYLFSLPPFFPNMESGSDDDDIEEEEINPSTLLTTAPQVVPPQQAGGAQGVQQPPAKRARHDTLIASALEQELARYANESQQNTAQSILTRRVKNHPLYQFAVRIAGSSGRGGQLDPLFLFDTSQGQRIVDLIINMDQKVKQFTSLRERAALEINRLLASQQQQRRASLNAATTSASTALSALDIANHRAAVRKLKAESEALEEDLTIAKQTHGKLGLLENSRGMASLQWWLRMNNAMVSGYPAEERRLREFIAVLFPTGAKRRLYATNVFTDQFGAVPDTQNIVNAAARYLGYDAPISPKVRTETSKFLSERHVARALVRAFMTDMFCDIPVGVRPVNWLMNTPIFSSFNYALFADLLLIPWLLSATKTKSTREMLTDLLNHSTLFKTLNDKSEAYAKDPLQYLFGIDTSAMDIARGVTTTTTTIGGGRPPTKPTTGKGRGAKNPGATTDSEDNTTGATMDSSARLFSGAPRFTKLVPRGGGGKPTASARPYVDDVISTLEQTTASVAITWLHHFSELGSDALRNSEQGIDNSLFVMCLQEALGNMMLKTSGQRDVFDFFIENLGDPISPKAMVAETDTAHAPEPAQLEFMRNLLARLGQMLDADYMKLDNNPITRNRYRYEHHVAPTINARMLHEATEHLLQGEPTFTLANSQHLDAALENIMSQYEEDLLGDLQDRLSWQTSPATMKTKYPNRKDGFVKVEPGTVDAEAKATAIPGWVGKLNNTLNHWTVDQPGPIQTVPEWLAEYWSKPGHQHVPLLNFNGDEPPDWINQFIQATTEKRNTLNDEIATMETNIQAMRAEMERLGQILHQAATPSIITPTPHTPLVTGGGGTLQPDDAQIAHLRRLDEDARKRLEELPPQLERAYHTLRQGPDMVTPRADWLQGMESAFRYLRGLAPGQSDRWCDAVGSAENLARSQNPEVLTSFAGLARCFMNTNEEAAGNRGVYQQSIYFAHNMRRAGDYARSLLVMRPEEARFAGFVHNNPL
jgi:hypothetical protein